MTKAENLYYELLQINDELSSATNGEKKKLSIRAIESALVLSVEDENLKQIGKIIVKHSDPHKSNQYGVAPDNYTMDYLITKCKRLE